MIAFKDITRIYEKQFYSTARIWIIVYIADCCNYNCHYCYNKKPRTQLHLDLNVLERFLSDIHRRTDKHIDLELIGGEPTLHPDIQSFCRKVSQSQYISIKLFTNLSQSVEFYSTLLQYDNLDIFASWHGTANDKKNLNFIDKAKQLNSKKTVYCVMFENDNWDNSIFAFEQLSAIYSNNVETSLIGENCDGDYEYTPMQLSFYKQHIVTKLNEKFSRQYTAEFKNGSCCSVSFNDLYLNNDISFKDWKCDAGYNHLYIHANGNVYQCQSYYDYNSVAETNIYKHNAAESVVFKPVICRFNTCSCTYCVKKENLRKICSIKNNT